MSPTFWKFCITQQNEQKKAFLYWDAPAMVTLCFNPFISSLNATIWYDSLWMIYEYTSNLPVLTRRYHGDTTTMGNLSKWIHQFEWTLIPGGLLMYSKIIHNFMWIWESFKMVPFKPLINGFKQNVKITGKFICFISDRTCIIQDFIKVLYNLEISSLNTGILRFTLHRNIHIR